jgi:hypothetical protein
MIDERVCTCRVPVAAPKSTARRAYFYTYFFSKRISGFTGVAAGVNFPVCGLNEKFARRFSQGGA